MHKPNVHSTEGISVFPTYEALSPGEGFEVVWINPALELVVGEIKDAAEKNNISAVRIPDYWMNKHGASDVTGNAPLPGEKVVYHLHGGAYVLFVASVCYLNFI